MISNIYKKKIWSQYRSLVFPLLIEQIFMMLIGNFNVFLLSLYNDQAVAATGIADQILSVGTMAMGIVSLGSTVLILQNADEKRVGYIQSTIRQAFFLNIILALLLQAIVLVLGEQLISWMQTPKELFNLSVSYLKIVAFSLVFQGFQTIISAVLRGYGKAKIAMILSVINTLLIILGNALIILGPGEIFGGGVIGIGMMIIFTRFLGAVFSFIGMHRYLPQLWENLWQRKKSDYLIAKKILSLGIPSGMENVFYNFSQTIITGVIASIGTAAVTGRIYTSTITAIVFTCSVAFGQASQIIIGQLIRSGESNIAQKFLLKNIQLTLLFSVVVTILIAIFGESIIHLFSSDPEIIQIVKNLLWLQCIYEPLRSINEVTIASLNVAGDVKFPVIIALVVTYLFTVPATLAVVNLLNLGIYAIWLVFIIDEGVRAILLIIRWWRGHWTKYNLVSREID